MNPAAAAKTAPTRMAITSRAGAEGMDAWRPWAAMTPEKAPTLIKPAWPRDSSPRMPTVRLRDTAMTM